MIDITTKILIGLLMIVFCSHAIHVCTGSINKIFMYIPMVCVIIGCITTIIYVFA